MAGLPLVIILTMLSCDKREELETANNANGSDEFVHYQKDTDPRWKWPNNLDDPDEPACIQGLSNCLEYCCVTPKTVSDFVDAIDAGTERTYLSDASILTELGQGFSLYENLLREVRDGTKHVIYYDSSDGVRVMILYGDQNVSVTKFDAAQALIR